MNKYAALRALHNPPPGKMNGLFDFTAAVLQPFTGLARELIAPAPPRPCMKKARIPSPRYAL